MLGEHASGPATGEPAITHNDFGDGGTIYVGVWPEHDLANAIVDDLLDRADVATTPPLPERVHVSQRGEYTWVTNFRSGPVFVDAPVDAEWVHGDTRIGGHDLAIVRADRHDLRVTPGK